MSRRRRRYRYAHLAGRNPHVLAKRGTAPGPAGVAGPAAPRRSGAVLVAAGVLLSRLSGLVREVTFAAYLATGTAADAFKAALRIPNLLQNLLGEGVLSASFIPVYSRLLEEDEREAGRVAGAVAGLLTVVAGAAAVVGVALARPITVALTPGFEGEKLDLTVELVRVMTPGIAVLVLSAWCLGVLNSHRRFFLSYVAPVLWNAAQVAVLVALGLRGVGDRSLAVAVAWGVLAGGLLQLLVQLPAVRAVGRTIRVSLDHRRAAVREVGRRFVPVLLGRGVVQLAGYLDLVLASLLAAGAVSALTYAQVLYLLPVSLFGMSVAAAELPELSRLGPGGVQAVRDRLVTGLGRVAFFVVPVQVLYLVAGGAVVGALLQRGSFGDDDTRLVWLVLAGASLGLVATTASRLLQSSLYALGDARSPAAAAAVRVAVGAALGVALMFQLDRVVIEPGTLELVTDGDLPAPFEPLPAEVRRDDAAPLRAGAVGLTLAASVGAWVELALLRRALRRASPALGRLPVGGPRRRALTAAAAVAGAVAVAAQLAVGDRLHPLAAAAVVLAPAGLAYLALTAALRVPEARALLRRT